ncbi:Panacea domain-containing protein [uncultured Selenomonas sp.]|uniref:Panacea domain-containing protein n=1 Tax=uncultured Selenomonas sp. TaxID=159275 RepID=UPI0025D06D66|nr:type II toxin-antitoxin system antitoxin SocA domain-containing protein [uncultured Selenomonas sp.]
MANVFDTAQYILAQTGRMSTMKLQKLCYYAQAWSLVWDDAPLFEEDFQAWANGPVCPELYARTKGRYSVTAEDEFGGTGDLTENQKDTIRHVLAHYGEHNAQWLSQLTHMEQPWREARKGLPAGVGSRNVITKESMAMYYGGL